MCCLFDGIHQNLCQLEKCYICWKCYAFMLKPDPPVHGYLVIHMGLTIHFPWNQYTNSQNRWKISTISKNHDSNLWKLEFGFVLAFLLTEEFEVYISLFLFHVHHRIFLKKKARNTNSTQIGTGGCGLRGLRAGPGWEGELKGWWKVITRGLCIW